METYSVRTFGCQMNKHDSERIAGILEAEGLAPSDRFESADVIVFNACCVRERAEERLKGQVASLSTLKDRRPGLLIAVGGCVAQRDGASFLGDFPHVDIVFGPNDIHRLPFLVAEARSNGQARVSVGEAGDLFASDLPSRRDRPWHAWVPITVGCDNSCSYCVVPSVRGRERDRSFESIVEEVEALVADGVVEVTLLGQNVNSYGRHLYEEPRFAEILEAVAASGVSRVRFTTSHPKDLSEDTVRVIASTPEVCSYLHLPVQSGSTDVLARMNRAYSKEDYLGLVDRLYAAIPELALSTDIMVGFPSETEQDFEGTMDVVAHSRFDQAFTFIFSPREGTPAASMPDQVPREVAQERFDRLVEAINASALRENERYVGGRQSVLVEGPSKRDPSLLLGRTSSNKVVHAPYPPETTPAELEGRFVDVEIVAAHTWFLEGRLGAYERER